MKLLVTNDDGVDAPGIAALIEIARRFGEVFVVAPDQVHSGCGHRVTSDGSISIEERGPNRWAISGTPADCVRVGLWKLVPDADWILSGINAGGNLGVDVFMSGTVAAVREAALHSKPGIALSQYRKSHTQWDWKRAAQLAGESIDRLLSETLTPGRFWNVNLPDLDGTAHSPELRYTPLNPLHLPMDFDEHDGGIRYSGNYHQRPRTSGDDVDVCFSGDVAITEMSVW
ncbi:MAG: 5'/3'-nucleotidase SurE [Planctomycetota bacterium]|jgi:5'-nucleotidase